MTSASLTSTPKPGFVGGCRCSASNRKILGVEHVVEQFGPLVVVDAHALFLQDSVVRNKVDVQARSQCQRAEWAMGRQRDIVGFGHGGDFVALGNAACM